MHTPGIMIAAPKSGSGKTLITCALLQACKDRGMPLSAFKCGPDYIDPMFHKKVIGVSSRNLDTFFSDEQQIRELFWLNRSQEEFSIIEGVMGLYDGLGGIREEGSSYHLAQTLDLPIILVMDAHGMGRTLIPVLAGLLQYDTGKRIAGVILNRAEKGFYETVAPIVEKELPIPVLGYFPYRKELSIESRYLGLKLPAEVDELRQRVKQAADMLTEHVDIERLLSLYSRSIRQTNRTEPEYGQMEEGAADKVRIAVAMDDAFNFYYDDNLRLLREADAELVEFSPLKDEALPEGIDGVLLGGGYPELYVKQLSANRSMCGSIQKAFAGGMPSVAECGGFMYLHEQLIAEDGKSYPMAGVVPGTCSYQGKLVRFGYVEITEKQPGFFKNDEVLCIKGHEFHYFDSTQNGCDCIARKPVSGKSWDCIWAGENYWWGFPHLYYPSNPQFVSSFVESCRRYRVNRLCTQGCLYGIGVGPGDPELLTLKAVRRIRSCDVIVLPAASEKSCYAYQIALAAVPEIAQKEVLCAPFPMVHDPEKLKLAHTQTYEKIRTFIFKGNTVGFLTIGDPSVYSTYMYVHHRAVEDGIKVQMISGLPSFCAAAARVGISLGEKQEEIHIIPGSYKAEDTLSYSGTRVYMKSGKKLKELISVLSQDERTANCEVYAVANCGMENEQVSIGLDHIDAESGYLTLVIVKEKEN